MSPSRRKADGSAGWPVLKRYDRDHLAKIVMPLGGIGTGTVGLGGRGDLRDWEIMNRPAKGFAPAFGRSKPFFAIRTQAPGGPALTRALEGPLEPGEYEGASGSTAANHGLPRFRECSFLAAYPLAQVCLADPDMPVSVRLEAFNPLVPGDTEASALPAAILRYGVTNRTRKSLKVSVCGTVPNFIGVDGQERQDLRSVLKLGDNAVVNRNRNRAGKGIQGVFMDSPGVPAGDPAWGTLALVTTAAKGVTTRTAWRKNVRWGEALLDFWQDFTADGRLDERPRTDDAVPVASVAVALDLPPGATRTVTFLLAWHFPNRQAWPEPFNTTTRKRGKSPVGNHYATRFADAWQAALHVAGGLKSLETRTVRFVRSFCESDLPEAVREAALFNLSVLRSQTCFRTPDGRFYGWEGCADSIGCCYGSCTHVWNYEQATPFLFGELARSMREVEFKHATDASGCMSFRVTLPLKRATGLGKAAADGQMGCIMKMYRDWQLSADDALLRDLWPGVRRSLEFCWRPGSWDADQDGVMEGCQHNTMDVEYFGPNPQMGTWYLGALRAAEAMARHLGETGFADKCRGLFERGSAWMDANLFNGLYYKHHIVAPLRKADVLPSLTVGMGGKSLTKPEYQLGAGCLVDQLVGQYMAHICGLGYLLKPANVRTTLRSIFKLNRRRGFHDHFNNMRSYALGDETALMMACYPGGVPESPFSYFTEVMTGFEYTAAVGMLYEGQEAHGLQCIADVRARYDGRKRNPFDEAECGHYYARAMASWAAVLALTGFHYSAVEASIAFAAKPGRHFWSTGQAWGTCEIRKAGKAYRVTLRVEEGCLGIRTLALNGTGATSSRTAPRVLKAGSRTQWSVGWQES